MRINAINNNIYKINNHRNLSTKVKHDVTNTQKIEQGEVAFRGFRGGLLGGIIGAGAAVALTIATGGAALGALPFIATVGAITGSKAEDEDDENDNNNP